VVIKDVEGLERSFAEVVYCQSDQILRLSREPGCIQGHKLLSVQEMSEEVHQVSIAIHPVEQNDAVPAYLISFEPENPVELINERLSHLGLSNREQEVVCLLCEGLKNSEIAKRLCISRYTVQNHLKSIFQKLNIRNRASLIHRVMTFY